MYKYNGKMYRSEWKLLRVIQEQLAEYHRSIGGSFTVQRHVRCKWYDPPEESTAGDLAVHHDKGHLFSVWKQRDGYILVYPFC